MMNSRFAAALILIFAQSSFGAAVLTDEITSLSGWTIAKSAGATTANMTTELTGPGCPCLRLDYEIQDGGGWIDMTRTIGNLPLPDDYNVQYTRRGGSADAGLEFKFYDNSSTNVWWNKDNSLSVESTPTVHTLGSQQIGYAWGPDSLKGLDGIKKYSFAVTSEKKATRGTIWLSHFQISNLAGKTPPKITRSTDKAGFENYRLDYSVPIRIGGLGIEWAAVQSAGTAQVSVLTPANQWQILNTFSKSDGSTTQIPITNVIEAKSILLQFKSVKANQASIKKINVYPARMTSLPANMMVQMAADRARGSFPKYLSKEQSYWTSIPLPQTTESQNLSLAQKISDFDIPATIMNQEGMLEFDHGLFSLEPALTVDGANVTWGQASPIDISLVDDKLPMPVSKWHTKDVDLTTTAYTKFFDNDELNYVTYSIQNNSSSDKKITLNLMIRPIPVTPYWQMADSSDWMKLAFDKIKFQDGNITIGNSTKSYSFHVAPVGATAQNLMHVRVLPFSSGPLVDFLGNAQAGVEADGKTIPSRSPIEKASGLTLIPITVKAGQSVSLTFAVFHSADSDSAKILSDVRAQDPETNFSTAKNQWTEQLGHLSFSAPNLPPAVQNSFESSLAFIMANRKGPALEPGPRRYATSWIRDGSMMAEALLLSGRYDMPKKFLEWFAQFQHEDGFIPCCVTIDKVDPLYIEHDSTGQFLYLAAEVLRYSQDEKLIRSIWPNIEKAVGFIRDHREGRGSLGGPAKPSDAIYGLMPKSVSHEGYLGNPVHAYWDDFWTLRGLRDAAYLAKANGNAKLASDWTQIAKDFETDLANSIHTVIAAHNIDYLPADVEVAEFDPSGTFFAIGLVQADTFIDKDILTKSFDMYQARLQKRIQHTSTETNYTAYEIRVVEPMVRIGRAHDARTVLDFFLKDQRPATWHQWPEISWLDPTRPTGIGDMPHTWIASEYIKAVRSLFFIEEPLKNQLLLGSGFTLDWFDTAQPILLQNASTYSGIFSTKITTLVKQSHGNVVTVKARVQAHMKGQGPRAAIVVLAPEGCRSIDSSGRELFRTAAAKVDQEVNFICPLR